MKSAPKKLKDVRDSEKWSIIIYLHLKWFDAYFVITSSGIRRPQICIASSTNGVVPWNNFLDYKNKPWVFPQNQSYHISISPRNAWLPLDSHDKQTGSWCDFLVGRWAAARVDGLFSPVETLRSGPWQRWQLWDLWTPRSQICIAVEHFINGQTNTASCCYRECKRDTVSVWGTSPSMYRGLSPP